MSTMCNHTAAHTVLILLYSHCHPYCPSPFLSPSPPPSLILSSPAGQYVDQVLAMEAKAKELGIGGELYYLFPSGGTTDSKPSRAYAQFISPADIKKAVAAVVAGKVKASQMVDCKCLSCSCSSSHVLTAPPLLSLPLSPSLSLSPPLSRCLSLYLPRAASLHSSHHPCYSNPHWPPPLLLGRGGSRYCPCTVQ
jgi:hypothetical protein